MAKTKKSSKSRKGGERTGEKTAFVRKLILENSEITPQQVRDKWVAAKLPEKDAPVDAFTYSLKNAMAKRWGLNRVSEIPRKKSGEINMTQLMHLFLGRNPGMDYPAMRKLFARNGVELKQTNFITARTALQKKVPMVGTVEMPATPLVPEGPRARKLVKGKKYGKRKKSPDEMTEEERTSVFYQGLERQLDEMIRMADNVKDSKLVEALRAGRRVASAKILQLT